VDVEFAANVLDDGSYRINLLQCRPFQCTDGGDVPQMPRGIAKENLLLEASGAVIGQSRDCRIDRFIYVAPEIYGQLAVNDRHQVARLIGRITRAAEKAGRRTTMLLGPGRWGTTSPSLGVPIRFSDISTVSVLCEIVAMREGLVPEVSLGTHLFGEMVEMDILYLALFPDREGNLLNEAFFASAPNRLTELVPDAEKWLNCVRVIDSSDVDGSAVRLTANTIEQRVVCYLERTG